MKDTHALQAWQIAGRVNIGDGIPVGDHPDLRSELYLKYAENAAYFETVRNFGGAVYQSMRNDVRDEIAHRQTRKAQFFAAMESLDAVKNEDGETVAMDIADPDATLERFFGGLDRKDRRRQMRNWRRKFRRRVLKLDDRLREFLFAMDACACERGRVARSRRRPTLPWRPITQEELVAATGLCRKSCYLWRQKLQTIFVDLLREHRAIKALEIK